MNHAVILQWMLLKKNAATDLRLSDMEVFVAVVNDVVLWAACSNETQTLKKQTRYNPRASTFNTNKTVPFLLLMRDYEYLCVRCELHGLLSGNTITWVEDGCRGNGSEHGQVLQTHLRGSVLT